MGVVNLSDSGFSSHFAALTFAGALAFLTIAVTASVEMPAMVDYLNHLARMELLSDGRAHPAYDPRWAMIPNLAMDILVPPLAQLIGAAAATKLFLILSQALVVGGAMALERVVKGRTGFAGLCAVVALFTTPVAWGLLNFTFALGVAIWGASCLDRVPGATEPPLGHSLCFCLDPICRSHVCPRALWFRAGALRVGAERASAPPSYPFRVALSAPAALLLALVAISGGAGGSAGLDWDFILKMRWLFQAFNVHAPLASTLTAVALGGLGIVLAASGALRLSREGVWIASGLAMLFLLLPRRIVGSAYLDVRVITASLLFFLHSVTSRGLAL